MMSRAANLRAGALSRSSVLALALMGLAPAIAQTSPGGAPPMQSQTPPVADQAPADQLESSSEAGGLADIIVTAQRRGENLQDTPITVNAITGELAAAKGVIDTADLQIVTPGLVFADSGIGPAIYLRGVGTQNTGFGDEGSVSTYVDGVVYTSLPAAIATLANVERIEVLKGPQGTLFGRNATGGLLNVITKNPSSDPSLLASINYGTYNTYGGELYATGPIAPNLAANFSAYYTNQEDGWGTNIFNGKDIYEGTSYSFRSKLAWTPSPRTEFILTGDYSRRRDSSTSGAVDFGRVGVGGNPGLKNFFDTELSLQPIERSTTGGVSLHARQDLSFAQITSVTAWRSSKLFDQFDNDRGPLVIADVTFDVKDKQFTQELQLQSLPESPVKWIVGGFYLRATTDQELFQIRGSAVGAFGGIANFPARQLTRSLAGYAQVTVPLGERTNITGGIRYTEDKRRLNSSTILPVPNLTIPRPEANIKFNKVTFRIAADHHITDDVMVFASFNRGFKSGIFNLLAAGDPPARPENLDAYEIGLKSEFFDRRLRFNISPFLYKYKDIQLSSATLTQSRLLNAARATVKGVDVDASFLVAEGFQIDANAEYLHGRYDRFPNAPGTFPRPATCTPIPTSLPGTQTGGNLQCPIDASGFRMIRSPTFVFSVGPTYTLETGNSGKFTFSANYFHSSSFPYEAGQRLKQPTYGVLNAQIAWRSPGDGYGVRIYGRNLTDEQYFTNRISSGGDTHASAAPITAGIALDVKF